MPNWPLEQHMSLETFMKWIDSDGDGNIDKKELRKALKKLGFRFTKLRAGRALRKVDGNHNRLVDHGKEILELAEYMRKHWNVVIDVAAASRKEKE